MFTVFFGVALPLLAAYLAGSFPSAVLFGRLFRGLDIRERGSGNAGATNALRVLGALPAALVLVADIAKALVAVLAAPLIASALPAAAAPLFPNDLKALCAACAILGHVFPIFARFKGGKGVAVAAVAVGLLHPLAIPFCLVVFGLALVLSGYASVASLAAALCFPLAAFLCGSPLPWNAADGALPGILALVTPVAILVTHRKNIARLAKGTEPRFEKAMLAKRFFGKFGGSGN